MESCFLVRSEVARLYMYETPVGSGIDSLSRSISSGSLMSMIDASAEFGDIATRLRDATADNHFDENERDAVATEIDQAQAALARMKALVLAQGAPRAVPVREVN